MKYCSSDFQLELYVKNHKLTFFFGGGGVSARDNGGASRTL